MQHSDILKLIEQQCKSFELDDQKIVAALSGKRPQPQVRKATDRDINTTVNTELTAHQEEALQTLLSGQNVFLTGKAGTGKSFLTRVFINKCRNARKNIIVCAPTGIAALNIGGATLHRTFSVPTDLLDTYMECESERCLKVIDKADIILIDEISMCRIDLFRFVANTIISSETRTQKKQVVVVGDFYQLPPVLRSEDKRKFEKIYGKKLYAFESNLWKRLEFKYIELEEVIRQKDPQLMTALNHIRGGIPDYSLFKVTADDDPEAITICGLNDEAAAINRQHLEKHGKTVEYIANSWGIFDKAPVEKCIRLAVGVRIIILANDNKGRWANGTLATVTALHRDSINIRIESGEEYELGYYTWETKEYHVCSWGGKVQVDADIIGGFSQLPVKLAYAITIHRSQGQTYDKVNIHPEGIFADGQLYVALSRARSLNGIRIVGKLATDHLKVSQKVIEFNTLMTTSSASSGQESAIAKEVVNKSPRNERGGHKTVKKASYEFSTAKGTETRIKIVELIKLNPLITSTEIASALNINRSAVQKHLNKLTSAGTILRTGSKKVGRWWWTQDLNSKIYDY